MLVLEGHVGKVHTLAFSPDGRTLASVAGRSGVVWLWDLDTRKVRAQLRHIGRVTCVAFAPRGGALLVTGYSRGRVTFWDPGSGRKLVGGSDSVVSPADPPDPGGCRLAFTPDGEYLACLQPLPVWRSNNLVYRKAGEDRWRGRQLWGRGVPHASCLAFSPDGEILTTGGFDRMVRLHRFVPWGCLYTMQQGSKVHFLAFAPDGRTLASASPDGLIKVWDAETGQKRTTLKGQARPLHAIAYSPEGRTLASAAGDGTVCLWDVNSGRCRVAFDWGVGAVHAVAFAPDGMRAAAGGEGKVVVWDMDDWDV